MADRVTLNYNLIVPLQEDFYDVDDFNANAVIIDAELKGLHDDVASLQGGTALSDHIADTTAHFTATEKADNARKDLNFRRKLRIGGMI